MRCPAAEARPTLCGDASHVRFGGFFECLTEGRVVLIAPLEGVDGHHQGPTFVLPACFSSKEAEHRRV